MGVVQSSSTRPPVSPLSGFRHLHHQRGQKAQKTADLGGSKGSRQRGCAWCEGLPVELVSEALLDHEVRLPTQDTHSHRISKGHATRREVREIVIRQVLMTVTRPLTMAFCHTASMGPGLSILSTHTYHKQHQHRPSHHRPLCQGEAS